MKARPDWRRLLALTCNHDYFADGVCRVLLLAPSAATCAAMRREGVRMRPVRGGIELYGPQAAADAIPLVFLLHSVDPALSNYTAGAGPEPGRSVWYFDDGATVDGALNWNGAASAGTRLLLAGRRLRQPLSEGASANWSLHGPSGEVGAGQAPATVTAGALEFDFADLPEGRYRLKLEGQAPLEFVLADAAPTVCWGVVVLAAGWPDTLRIALTGRSTRWRYHLLGLSAEEAQACRVSARLAGQAGEIDFERSPALPEASDAICFVSSAELPLYEAPASRIEVALRWAAEMPASSVSLPYAQGRVPPRGQGGIYSDIFVHLGSTSSNRRQG